MSAKAYYHLPGLFEFYEFYRAFLPLYRANRDWFYDWCEIGSIYGAPADCLWGGGRAGFGECGAREALALAQEYGVSARLTFSNSLLREEHLSNRKCNALCELFSQANGVQNGVIVHSELLTDYLRTRYPALYLVSSTTKVLTDFEDFRHELDREEFRYVVPDFRLNKRFEELNALSQVHKDKVEFLCNECCWFGCNDRKRCYEVVSRKNLGEDCPDHICTAPGAGEGYRFSKAMENPSFIGVEDIRRTFMYHGAEHKCINCVEHGHPLTVKYVRESSKEHKRCGTSFILIVMVISILMFMVIRVDTIWMRILSRIILVPVIAGISYEVLQCAGRSNSKFMDLVSRPGMWMQGLTTKEPDDSMIEVAIAATEAVFDWREYLTENFPGWEKQLEES